MTAARLEQDFPYGVVVAQALHDLLDEHADGLAVLQQRCREVVKKIGPRFRELAPAVILRGPWNHAT